MKTTSDQRQTMLPVAGLLVITAMAVVWQVGAFSRFHRHEPAAAIFDTADGPRYHLWSVTIPYYSATGLIIAAGAYNFVRLWASHRWGAWVVIGTALFCWLVITVCVGTIEMIGYQRPFI
jgi:hypothetical protein